MEQTSENSKFNFENLDCKNKMEEEEEDAYNQTHEDKTVFFYFNHFKAKFSCS